METTTTITETTTTTTLDHILDCNDFQYIFKNKTFLIDQINVFISSNVLQSLIFSFNGIELLTLGNGKVGTKTNILVSKNSWISSLSLYGLDSIQAIKICFSNSSISSYCSLAGSSTGTESKIQVQNYQNEIYDTVGFNGSMCTHSNGNILIKSISAIFERNFIYFYL